MSRIISAWGTKDRISEMWSTTLFEHPRQHRPFLVYTGRTYQPAITA